MDADNSVRSALRANAAFWTRVTWSIAAVSLTSMALAILLGWVSLDNSLIVPLSAG